MSAFRSVPALRSVGPSRAQRQSVRYAHDLIIQHRTDSKQTPQPVIKKGPPTGGRSAVSGHTVTVFGCTGFLGRYLVSKLGKAGTQVIVPYRDEDSKRPLKVMGDLGQIVPLEWDARNPDQIYECVKHSDVVYNLTGRDWETRNFKYDDVNVKAAKLIAEVSAAANVPRLVHVSHMNAAADSESDLYRTKWEGERAVRDAFPEATIVRPARMFGPEDGFLSDIAQWPYKYKLNGGETRVMPVHVMDVAEALNVILTAPVTSTASTFVLPGPEAYTHNELINLVEFFTLKKLGAAMTIPRPVIEFAAKILNRAIWWPTISPDEIRRMYIDDLGVNSHLSRPDPTIPSGWGGEAIPSPFVGVDGEAVKGFADLGISPDLVEEHAQKYLRRFRNASSYDTPLETGHFKPTKRYHTIP